MLAAPTGREGAKAFLIATFQPKRVWHGCITIFIAGAIKPVCNILWYFCTEFYDKKGDISLAEAQRAQRGIFFAQMYEVQKR